MKSFLSFLSLLLFAATIAAGRKDGGEYWRAVMKDEPMPEAIKGLIGIDTVVSSSNEIKTKCHTPTTIEIKEENIIVEEEEKKKKSFADDIEPRPNISGYDNGDLEGEKSLSFAQDFEPRPNVSAYANGELKGEKSSSFAQDFEPSPNVSAYGDDDAGLKGEKKSFSREFKPEGTTEISIYHG
ncbi:hypothetical protein PTKIN_Ptkin10aG0143000 [Pterospermum kingtungense]